MLSQPGLRTYIDSKDFFNTPVRFRDQRLNHPTSRFSREERLEIDRLLPARKRLLKRAKQVDAKLARIEREGAIIKKHCSASADETQAAIKAYQKKLEEARALIVGSEFILEQAKQQLKQLSS